MTGENKKRGKLIIITGPSGVGKDTVIEGLKKSGLEFSWIITTTTRAPRPGESEGRPYYFVSRERFEKMIKDSELLEWAEVYGNYYGSTLKEVLAKLEQNRLVILKPDPVGAKTIKGKFREALTIFIAPPSFEALRRRLIGRGTDTPEAIERRLAQVRKEMEMSRDFDEIVVNEEGKLNETAAKIREIIENAMGEK